MDKNDDKRRQLLVELAGNGGGAHQRGAEVLLQPWRRLARQLSPLIGESGFCALYGRAGRLVQPDHAWLAGSPPIKTIEGAIDALAERFGTVSAEQAQAANLALLDQFTKLLADLIGEALTIRLLHSSALGIGDQKNAQEQK